jgi:hypothetical protein
MAKSRKNSASRQNDFETFQGGELADAVVARQLAAARRKWLAELNEETAIDREAAKHFKQLAPSSSGGSPNEDAAIAGLGRLTERLSKRKLAVPRTIRELPDVWGSYTLKFTPPYLALGTSVSGQISSVTGNPTISATGVDNLRCQSAHLIQF